MFGWSINLFRIRGIQLAVHASFLLLLAWYAYNGFQDNGIAGMIWNSVTLVLFFACVVLHELGHSFTGMHYGMKIRRILLMPIGGAAQFDSITRQPKQEIVMTLAGPAVNFVLAAILWPIVDMTHWSPDGSPASILEVGQYLLVANIVMGCFNLLPVFPMDGGRILRAILAIKLPYLRATQVAVNIGKVLAVLAIAYCLYIGNYLTATVFTFIFIAGNAEYRMIQRQELAQAHWEEMMRHLARGPVAATEPPLLEPKPPQWELGP